MCRLLLIFWCPLLLKLYFLGHLLKIQEKELRVEMKQELWRLVFPRIAHVGMSSKSCNGNGKTILWIIRISDFLWKTSQSSGSPFDKFCNHHVATGGSCDFSVRFIKPQTHSYLWHAYVFSSFQTLFHQLLHKWLKAVFNCL